MAVGETDTILDKYDRFRTEGDVLKAEQYLSGLVERASAAFTPKDVRGLERLRDALSDGLKDSLTGIANRGFFDQAFDKTMNNLRRISATDNKRYVLIFADLDNFKSVNEDHSYSGGDKAIQATANALRSITRKGEILARLGGDEFVLIAEEDGFDTDFESKTLSRVQQALQPVTVDMGSYEFEVTGSAGAILLSGLTLKLVEMQAAENGNTLSEEIKIQVEDKMKISKADRKDQGLAEGIPREEMSLNVG